MSGCDREGEEKSKEDVKFHVTTRISRRDRWNLQGIGKVKAQRKDTAKDKTGDCKYHYFAKAAAS